MPSVLQRQPAVEPEALTRRHRAASQLTQQRGTGPQYRNFPRWQLAEGAPSRRSYSRGRRHSVRWPASSFFQRLGPTLRMLQLFRTNPLLLYCLIAFFLSFRLSPRWNPACRSSLAPHLVPWAPQVSDFCRHLPAPTLHSPSHCSALQASLVCRRPQVTVAEVRSLAPQLCCSAAVGLVHCALRCQNCSPLCHWHVFLHPSPLFPAVASQNTNH